MTEVQQRRRNAHYNTEEKSRNPEKSQSAGIFFKTVICMIILFCSFYFSSNVLSDGKTLGSHISQITSSHLDLSEPYKFLRKFISDKIGQVPLPDPYDSTVFNETTPTKPAN